jgi:hypothetical protein
MKLSRLIFFILVSLLVLRDVWAIQQITRLPDAQVEEILLKEVEGATREGTTLRLRTTAGMVTFEDRVEVGEGSAKYFLVGFRDSNGPFNFIRVIGYESHGFVLVNKKPGQVINLYGFPIFSPDGSRFVDVSLDLDAGYVPNLIHIYKLEDSKYALEWKYMFEGMKGPSDPVWLNDSAIVFFEVTFTRVPTVSNLKKNPYIIERINNKWNIPRALK